MRTTELWQDDHLPTVEQIRGPGASEAEVQSALMLVDAGVHPWNVPSPRHRTDVFTRDGYLRLTGRVFDEEFETERQPYPFDGERLDQFLELAAQIEPAQPMPITAAIDCD